MAEPAAVRAALSFQNQLASSSEKQILAMGRRWQGVESNLQASIDALADEIAALSDKGEAVPAWKLYQMERYQSLIAQIQGELSKYMSWAIVQMEDEGRKAQAAARLHAAEMLALQAGGKTGTIEAALDKLGVGAAEKITGLSQAGNPLDKILSSAYPTAVNAMTNKLITGAALGWNPRKTAREMVRGGLDHALNHVLLVARDQQIRNSRETQRDAYKASNVVYGYMRLARKAKRTCLACLALDGTIYPTSEVMELHPQDRCSMIPLVVGRPVPRWETGLDWFRKQSPSDQRDMMGPQTYRLWQDGLFELEKIVTVKDNPTWGPNAQVTTAKALKAGGGGVEGRRFWTAGDLLKKHQATAVTPNKAKTIDLKENAALVAELKSLLPKSKLPLAVKTGINNVLKQAGAGDSAYTYLDEEGKLAGAVAWKTKKDNQFFTEITAAGFADEATNKKALLDVGAVALSQGRGLLATVPTPLIPRYLDWGFAITKGGQHSSTMVLGGDDLPKFLASPEAFGVVKKEEIIAQMNSRLADPQGTAVFRSGYALPDTGYNPTTLDKSELPGLKKELPDSKPLEIPEGKHAAAGILLVDPKTGKTVLVNPAGGFGGAKTTIPKGTVEPGEDFQETAIREVFEETGFKAKIVGLLGDYEKTTSMNRLYIGIIEDGAPWAGHFETEAVQIVPIEDVRKLVDTGVDKTILKDFETTYKAALQKGGGDLEKGLDIIAAEKAESEKVLSTAQKEAYFNFFSGYQVSIEEVKLAKAWVEKNDPDSLPEINKELAAMLAAEAEAKQKAKAEAEKAGQLVGDFLNKGPDVLTAVRLSDLRTAIAWAYENGISAMDIADLEAIAATRAESKSLQAIVALPQTLQGAGKDALINHLVGVTGATPWKLKQLTKPQIEALFGTSKETILQAAEDGAAKYYNAKAAKFAPPEPPPPPDLGIYIPQHLTGKAQQVAHFVTETGVAKWKLNQLSAAEIAALSGKTKEEILQAGEQGAAKYYAAKGKPKPQANTPAALAARSGGIVTPEIARDKKALAAVMGVRPSQIVGQTDRYSGQGTREVLDQLATAATEQKAMVAFSDWLDSVGGASLHKLSTADLEAIDKYLDSVSVDQGINESFIYAVKGVLAEKKSPKTPPAVSQTAVASPPVVTKDLISSKQVLADWLGIDPEEIPLPSWFLSKYLGKTQPEIFSELAQAEKAKQMAQIEEEKQSDFDLVLDASFDGESLDKFTLDQLNNAWTHAVGNYDPDASIIFDIEQAIAAKETAAKTPFDPSKLKFGTGAGQIPTTAAKTFPVPTGKTANLYVEQLVFTGLYSSNEILDQVKAIYPKSIFTLQNVKDKFKKLGIIPPEETNISAEAQNDFNVVSDAYFNDEPMDTFTLQELNNALSLSKGKYNPNGPIIKSIEQAIARKQASPQKTDTLPPPSIVATPAKPPQTMLDKGKQLYELGKTGVIPQGVLHFVGKTGIADFEAMFNYVKENGISSESNIQAISKYLAALKTITPLSNPENSTKSFLANYIAQAIGTTAGPQNSTLGTLKKMTKPELLQFFGIGESFIKDTSPTAAPSVKSQAMTIDPTKSAMANVLALAEMGQFTATQIYNEVKAKFPYTFPKLKSVKEKVAFFAEEKAKASQVDPQSGLPLPTYKSKPGDDLETLAQNYAEQLVLTGRFTARQIVAQIDKVIGNGRPIFDLAMIKDVFEFTETPEPPEPAPAVKDFPEPTGKGALFYATQLVKTGRYTPQEILDHVKATFPEAAHVKLTGIKNVFLANGISETPAKNSSQAAAPLDVVDWEMVLEGYADGDPLTKYSLSALKNALNYGLANKPDLAIIEELKEAIETKESLKTADVPKSAIDTPTKTYPPPAYKPKYDDDLEFLAFNYTDQLVKTGEFTAKEILNQVNATFGQGEQIIDMGIVTDSFMNSGLSIEKIAELTKSQPTKPSQDLQQTTKQVLNVTGASPELVSELSDKAAAAFSGSSLTASYKAMANIGAGHQGIVYLDDTGKMVGVIALQNVGGALKMTGAAFANPETNATAVADALKAADKMGLPLETWVPASVQTQYKVWGFKNTSSNYYALKLSDASSDLIKHASPSIKTQADVAPVPMPQNAPTMTAVQKMSKSDLVNHISVYSTVPKAKLNKLDKDQLVSLVGTNPAKLVDDMIEKKEQEAALVAPFNAWKQSGTGSIKTSAQGKKVLDYIQAKGAGGLSDLAVDELRTHVDQLAQEERESSPYTPRFEPTPPPKLPAKAALPTHKDFPAKPEELTVVKKLGGSTGAELVKTPDGRLFVRKKGASEGHLREEAYSDAAYQAAGFNVPRFQLYETADGPIKLAEYVAGKTLNEAIKTATTEGRRAILEQVRAGFAMDAMMGNWDVLGRDMDNVLIDEAGKVWRIDNGGSLRYRAMGGQKTGNDWNGYPTEIWTMREQGRGGAAENNARIFGDLDIYQIMDQSRGVIASRDAILASLPEEARQIVYQRIEYLRDAVQVSDMVRRDKFTADYTDPFLRESTYIRQEGIIDRLPKKLKQTRAGSVTVVDEKGKEFDELRGPSGHVAAVGKYMRANGANMDLITTWMREQAGDSWNDAPRAVKYARALARGGNFADYWWKPSRSSSDGLSSSKKAYDEYRKRYGSETFDKTLAIWHAFTFESLRKMDFAHDRPDGGFVEIVRTENDGVIQAYKIKESLTEPTVFKRGPAESGSIYQSVRVFGDQLTLQRVPWHRVWGYYFQSKGESYEGAFLGDAENEFVFDGDGLPTYYAGRIPPGRSVDSYWKELGD